MSSKYERINDNVKRLAKMKDATILKYNEDIDYDDNISLYDVMMKHFALGEFDDAFLTNVTKGMTNDEKKDLFNIVRPYIDLCFAKGDVNYWLDSVENAAPTDYDFIAVCILDNFDFLLEITKEKGVNVLSQMQSLRENPYLREQPIVQYLRDPFIDDRVLKVVLCDMAEDNSYYNMFSNAQKGTLLNYPEGTLYSYGDEQIRITSPYILGSRMFNDFYKYLSVESIGQVTSENINYVNTTLTDFFADDSFDFEDTVLDLSARYRDYKVQTGKFLDLDKGFKEIVYDDDGRDIQIAWDKGDGILGSSYEIPYVGGTK